MQRFVVDKIKFVTIQRFCVNTVTTCSPTASSAKITDNIINNDNNIQIWYSAYVDAETNQGANCIHTKPKNCQLAPFYKSGICCVE